MKPIHFKTFVFAAWIPLVMVSVSGCKKKESAAPVAPPQVEVVAVAQKDVPIYREWVGTLAGEVNATISAQVTGYLVERAYQEGSIVTNGQVLFQLEKAPFEAALAKAKAQLDEAKARKGKTELDVQRYTPLAKSEAISKQELDNAIQADKAAAAEIESGQAALQQAQLNLNFTTIRAPVDGIAGLAQAQIGNLIGPNSGPLTTVTKSNPIRVHFSVSQQLMTEMQERTLAAGKSLRSTGSYQGPELELILASGSAYPLKGQVRFADNQVDVKTGTIRVVGEFPNPQRLLIPGMFTRVRALLDTQKNALLVPQRAVTDMQGRSLIAVVGPDNKVNIRPVTAGERVGADWVIEGNLKAGDRVVAEGIQKVRDGTVVNPVPLKVATATAPANQPAETNQ
ncbi:MAG TPA: efflux RND transporter periplasmic adaptor subunit [Candidatus Sulfotelmatobacter sp.]|nr:efflux RND transporter periplasmic adaptor subunit [Candidatus Sulfotelmatobacter sp.]HWI58205.1 efflux RND transporter periplasmic adaptor subunit [Bacillota bacterium]